MQLDEFNNQQNGNYQTHPEPLPAVRVIYSPPALVEPQMPQGLNQPLTAPASEGNYTQASTQSREGVHQQTAARLQPGTYQQADAQKQPYQSQTVGQAFLRLQDQLFILLFGYFFSKKNNDDYPCFWLASPQSPPCRQQAAV